MAWRLLPRIRPEYSDADRNPAFFWRSHVPLVAGAAALLWLPVVHAWSGIRPLPASLLLAGNLLLYGSYVHTPIFARFPVGYSTLISTYNFFACASLAIFSYRPTSLLWVFHLLYPHVLAQAAGFAVVSALTAAAVPLLTAVYWHLTGAVPFSESVGPLSLVSFAATAAYVFLARLHDQIWGWQQERREAAQAAAAERERQRIARELHTTLGAALTEVALWQEVARVSTGLDSAQALDRAHRRARTALNELRLSVNGLQSRAMTPAELEGLLRRRLQGLCEAGGMELAIEFEAPPADLPATRGYHIMKFVEEAALNALRHAHARRLRVRVRVGATVAIAVEDDGAGFDPSAVAPGLGLRALESHAAALQGRFELQSSAGHGTRVVLTSPSLAMAS